MSSAPASPSPAHSPQSGVSILTPTRKVKALLAQFDDSDSSVDDSARPQPKNTQPPAQAQSSPRTIIPEDVDDDSEDEDILAPRRLQAPRPKNTPSPRRSHDARLDAIFDSSSDAEADGADRAMADLEEEDNFAAQQRPDSINSSPSTSQSKLPLSSPSSDGPKSKFLALVQKHRKQRQDKEAEEAAKQAERQEKLKALATKSNKPRGSSPADDTAEDSDISEEAGGKKLSTQARPTRKASKKALEEMNRETQRMSRNMQLAHQARTKKKISKDSLLARFNFSVAASKTSENHDSPQTSSSRTVSDDEAEKVHETPPTSPITEVAEGPKLDKGKGRALSVEPMEEPVHTRQMMTLDSNQAYEEPLKPTVKPLSKSARTRLLLSSAGGHTLSDSDSDLEVVTSRAETRKYAVFEHLRSRKAKETPSHIALRSLANIAGEERKRSINATEMETSLRRAARMQARQERQQRIDELKAKGVVIQTAEEREREQQEVEDLLERARQEAADIQKREKALAKKEGNYTKDNLDEDDEDESDDEDFADEEEGEPEDSEEGEDSDLEQVDQDANEDLAEIDNDGDGLIDNEASEQDSAESSPSESDIDKGNADSGEEPEEEVLPVQQKPRKTRPSRIVSDDEEEDLQEQLRSPHLPAPAKTPQSLTRSAKKQIPGLQMSDDLPIGLTQAFAATMADSQSQDFPMTQEQDSLTMTADLPSPNIAMVPKLYRLDSVDMITDSQPTTQTQPLNVNLSFSESQIVPQSPAPFSGAQGPHPTPSQAQFEPTQDAGYVLSPFMGNRFATETPQHLAPHSTVDTVILPEGVEDSPIVQRRARLQRGRVRVEDSDDDLVDPTNPSAFDVMKSAATKRSREAFDKQKSRAREAVDEAAEESEDEYAGLGGASDDENNEEENEEDRKMIDEDTQVGVGDEAKLAKLFADRERAQDEAAVSKLLKDITTGALRRKRGNDDLDLSDEEDALVRRREAKRREFAKMRRELLKDEAVGKIAEDKKKEAFLRSIEDRQDSDEGEDDFNHPETQPEDDSQVKNGEIAQVGEESLTQARSGGAAKVDGDRPLATSAGSKLNRGKQSSRRDGHALNRRPATLAEIRESVSFLIEEPDSQAGMIDLGLSESEDEPEAYVNLDRHLESAEADENADDGGDLGDFIVDDETDGGGKIFKKPAMPSADARAPFSERRTKEVVNVVNRLTLLRQASSSSSSTKMAFHSTTSSAQSSFNTVPTLLRRATTNSSLGGMAGRNENVSATGVVTSKVERGKASEEKEFVRKGTGGRRNAVNYRPTIKEEKMSQRAGVVKKTAAKGKKNGFLGELFNGGSWN